MIIDKAIATTIAHKINSGYWHVNGHYFFNKAECLRYASLIKNHNVTFHFFDEVYNTLDWTKEPTQSLDSLYAERALQIREKYEHVALLFSGGCDSTNMLHSFLKNNIKLDEIISYYPLQIIDKFKSNFNKSNTDPENAIYEYFESVVPTLEWLRQHHPDIKITVLDTSETTINLVQSENVYKIMLAGLIVHPQHSGLYLAYEHLRKNKKRSVAVAGVDKPRLSYDTVTHKLGAYFFDFVTVQGHWPVETFNEDAPCTEYFYFSNDLPILFQKQCFVLKHFLQKLLLEENSLINEVLIPIRNSDKKILNVQHNAIKQVLYSTWNTNIFQADKIRSYFFNDNAAWFWKSGLVDNRSQDFYSGQLTELLAGVDSKFIETDANHRPSKFRDMFSSLIYF